MALRRGPFTLQWIGNTISDVEEIETEVTQDTDDHDTLDGRRFVFDGPIQATATIKLLRSDIATLAVLLPQYFVPNGGTMSTGEIVSHADGAIDVLAASCDAEPLYGPLDVVSCGNPGQVFRLVNARTKIDAVEFDPFVGTVDVQFIGEPAAGEANVQFFHEGSLAVVS